MMMDDPPLATTMPNPDIIQPLPVMPANTTDEGDDEGSIISDSTDDDGSRLITVASFGGFPSFRFPGTPDIQVPVVEVVDAQLAGPESEDPRGARPAPAPPPQPHSRCRGLEFFFRIFVFHSLLHSSRGQQGRQCAPPGIRAWGSSASPAAPAESPSAATPRCPGPAARFLRASRPARLATSDLRKYVKVRVNALYY